MMSSAQVLQITPQAQAVLSVLGLSKTVQDSSGELSILHTLSFDVLPGESVAIVGASGSGKSTLLSLLAGLDTPSTGHVLLCGQDLAKMNEDERAAHRARHVGFVFQSFQLISHLTALENVMLPLELQGDPQAQAKAQAMLERVGLTARLKHRPLTLSGGEQQRVALARAFVMHPDVLMADEPTGSLDHATGLAVMDLMFSLNAERGTTLILVTHDNEIAQRCSRRLHIHGGMLTEAQ